jgi:ribosomal protein L11 methyltransferase
MVRLPGEIDDFGDWPIAGAEHRETETWIYFSSRLVARSFAKSSGGKLEAARWEVNLDYQRQWTPKPVGQSFYLAPPWDESPTPPRRFRLTMQPGLVFGAGDHDTTCLSLALLETVPLAGRRVFDLGSGTGILSLAARHLGAAQVIACDTDADAAQLTHQLGVPAVHGPSSAFPDQAFDVLLANIPGYVHLDLAPEYHRLLRPGGTLLLSGYYDWQIERIEAALPSFTRLTQTVSADSWVASIFSHALATASSA